MFGFDAFAVPPFAALGVRGPDWQNINDSQNAGWQNINTTNAASWGGIGEDFLALESGLDDLLLQEGGTTPIRILLESVSTPPNPNWTLIDTA